MTETNKRDCKHGRLARSCEICDLEKEVAELNRELDSIARLAESLHDSPKSLLSHMAEWAKQRRMAAMPNAEPNEAAAGSLIPEIQSAVLNIGTASNDCASAREAWIDENWNDATMWISNAIAQLESARAKIYAHQESLSASDPSSATAAEKNLKIGA
jgi:hypothetical protein